MKFWVRWQGAGDTVGPRVGPFDHREDAVRHVEGEMNRFADSLAHGTGVAGWWKWTHAREVAVLYRDDVPGDVAFGQFRIDEVVSGRQ